MTLTSDERAYLRELISEPAGSTEWPDERMDALGPGALLPNGTYDLRLYAALIWEAKAADTTELVNVSESGSSRNMSQVFDHAVKMAERFRAPAPTTTNQENRPRSTRISRARPS